MSDGRVGDLATGVIGTAAGTVVDPRQGIRQIRSHSTVPVLVAVGVLVGYLIGRRMQRRG
ncbi:hypothetical protein [Plantactinospora soyae]|uniref:Uncharacterized protein n=1 Tax=Plantactinospora soyae TaxID=1544732 RepID=A0A927R9Z8_9ACTN|nr:hypothetical protein [Plantactinospora soyae]MBE1491909.1 hypothetical protein [Plantactinospora soyae]